MKLWYNTPAELWCEALPIGNGRLGGMVFGRVETERIQFNEDSLWSGRIYHTGNPALVEQLPAIRGLILDERYDEAERIAEEVLWLSEKEFRGYGMYQLLSNLWLHFPGHEDYSDYRRELDIDRGVVHVSYRVDDTVFHREIFASHADQAVVVRLTADGPTLISLVASMSRAKKVVAEALNACDLVLAGSVTSGSRSEGLGFNVRARAVVEGGELTAEGTDATALVEELTIDGAEAVTFYVTAATEFRDGEDLDQVCRDRLRALETRAYDDIHDAHAANHQALMDRVDIDFGAGDPAVADEPTDVRLELHAAGRDDPELVALFFQFGRYLLVASSRPGSLPANRQGLWNAQIDSPFSCDYHLDVHTQMSYWPAELTNLSECHEPLLEYVRRLSETGAITAREIYGCDGWVAHTHSNIWAFTDPHGNASYAMWPCAGAWLCRHLWEHFEFTQDVDFLAEVYPVMKGAVLFFMASLVWHPRHRKLVTCPSCAPESRFQLDDGAWHSLCAGPAMDSQILRDLLTFTMTACRIVEDDEAFHGKMRALVNQLPATTIGGHGQLQEWLSDLDDPDDAGPHLSPLFALCPGNEIVSFRDPEFADAARTSLEWRGDGGPSWSLAWKMNCRVRLGEGDHAYRLMGSILRPVDLDDEDTSHGGVYPNFLCAFPPYMFEANLGATAAMAEMLLQSHSGQLHLLPALPSAWSDGHARGLRARGGFTVDIHWAAGELGHASIHAAVDGPCVVRADGPLHISSEGEAVATSPVDGLAVSFDAEAGATYIVATGG